VLTVTLPLLRSGARILAQIGESEKEKPSSPAAPLDNLQEVGTLPVD